MKKILKKKEDKVNKIISTQDRSQDRKMSITIMDNPPTDKNKNEENKIQEIKERTESEENLFNAIKLTESLRNKLKEKEEDYKEKYLKDDNELLLINQIIKEKSEKLEKVSKNSKLLLNKLNLLNSQINKEYNKAKIIQVANKIRINYSNLKIKDAKKVNQGKKIILLNNNIIEKFKIQKEKLEKIIEEDKNLKINKYTKKLNDLIKYKTDLTKEIENLRLTKNNHEKKCLNLNEDLNKILERLKNEYNNEYKTKNNNNNINLQYNNRKNSITNSPINSLPKIINANILTSPSNLKKPESENPINININKEKFNSKNSKSMKNIFDPDYLLQKDLKKIKEQVRSDIKIKLNQKIKRYLTSYSEEKKKKNIKEYKKNEKTLFSKLENEMLSKIIPKECLQIYQDKFKTIEEKTFQIRKQLNKNEKEKKLNKEKTQLLFITEKKDINLTKKNIELNSKISIIKEKYNNILKEIKKIKKEYNNINEKYNNKKEENDKIKIHWNEFSNDIKNKKLAIKNGETIEKKELDILNKWGNNILISFNKKINDEEACDNNNQKNKKMKNESKL